MARNESQFWQYVKRNTPKVAEVWGDYQFFVNFNDTINLDEVYSSIDELLKNKKYLVYGRIAKENSTKFHWDIIIEKYNPSLNYTVIPIPSFKRSKNGYRILLFLFTKFLNSSIELVFLISLRKLLTITSFEARCSFDLSQVLLVHDEKNKAIKTKKPNLIFWFELSVC